ncbi:MAG: DUF3656 domain-containing protein, partial [Planctomycetota bacterium]|nr:DUF3656 domain-containing protein [Planctomycetota bacterium]
MTEPRLQRPELLAPAGDWEAMRAAVANGADAVYFGLTRYSARHRATNFRLDELPEVIRYLHGHNVRGYVTFNTLIFSDELAEAAEFAAAIASAGADAVIVQDLGLARLIRRLAPTLPIHASTQMTLTEPRAIEFVRRLGIERVILARELSIAQIRQIAAATPMPLEVFVHGALCMSYSGQCLASKTLWGRSANRGLCGQACRLPYRLIVDGRVRRLGDKAYLLSTKDLAAYDRLAELVQLGIAGFKIEGRLKSAEYVAIATQVYRAAIDAAVAGQPLALPPRRRLDLVQSYSRGFTHGFLDGANHTDLVHGRSPNSRGICLGKVVGKNARGVIVVLDPPREGERATLRPGDGFVFDNGRPGEDEQGGRLFSAEPQGASGKRPARLLLTFGKGDVDLAAVTVDSTVWKTDDPKLRRELENTYSRDVVFRRAPLAMRLHARVGQPLQLSVEDSAGNRAEAMSDRPLERAEKRPLTLELAREHLGRLGETPFELGDVAIAGEHGQPVPSAPVMAPKSVLNDLRRQAVHALLQAREAKARHTIAEPDALDAIRGELLASSARDDGAPPPHLYVLVRRPDQLDAALAWAPPDGLFRPAMVYCDFPDPSQHLDAVARCRAAAIPVGLATLRIAKPDEEDLPNAVLVRHLAGLSFFRERAPHLALVGDFSLNVANEISAAILGEPGLAPLLERALARITASLDLNAGQLAAMLARFPAGRCEVIAHLHMPMMHMEHCVLAAHLADTSSTKGCGRPCARHRVELRDRVGAEHPLIEDARCRGTLFSGHVQSAAPYLGEMQRLGVRHFRLEFVSENATMISRVLDLYARVMAASLEPQEAWRRL